uniref:Uncharacterized protein n=1 Tax=Haematobia irritans TaxID=7368 RepID=A0A1L8E601_HAEIR
MKLVAVLIIHQLLTVVVVVLVCVVFAIVRNVPIPMRLYPVVSVNVTTSHVNVMNNNCVRVPIMELVSVVYVLASLVGLVVAVIARHQMIVVIHPVVVKSVQDVVNVFAENANVNPPMKAVSQAITVNIVQPALVVAMN